MNLIDVNNVVRAFACHTVHHLFDALLEVAAILCAGQHRAQVQHIYTAAFQPVGHVASVDAGSQSVDQRRLTHTGFAYMQGIVLVATAEHLYGTLQLGLAANERVLLIHHVVHTRHQSSPSGSLLRTLFTLVLVYHAGLLVGRHDVADEFRLTGAQMLLQQIGSPRLFQFQHGHHNVGYVQRVGTT